MKRLQCLALFFTLIVMYGCGGGSTAGQPPSKGVFFDSPVAGISYKTASLSGITNEKGEFQYLPGETVTFSVGDANLGSAPASSKVTPIDLGTSSNDTNPKTINIARFLQSLDSDGNHDNGIQITPEIRAELAGKNIDFSKSVADFDDADMQALFGSMNGKGVFTDGAQRSLVSDLTAQYNLRHSLNPSLNPFDGGWTTVYQYPIPGSTGGTISVGSHIPPPDLPSVNFNSDFAVITISGSIVTFTPVSGKSVTGTISTSGIITIPDRTTNCKDSYYGKQLELSSKLTLNLDGSINGEWWIGAPDTWPGYCYPYLVKATFPMNIHLSPPITIPTILSVEGK